MGNVQLKESFTSLFSLVEDSTIPMAELYDVLGSIWVPRLRRNPND